MLRSFIVALLILLLILLLLPTNSGIQDSFIRRRPVSKGTSGRIQTSQHFHSLPPPIIWSPASPRYSRMGKYPNVLIIHPTLVDHLDYSAPLGPISGVAEQPCHDPGPQ
jgi:hypothetical protein